MRVGRLDCDIKKFVIHNSKNQEPSLPTKTGFESRSDQCSVIPSYPGRSVQFADAVYSFGYVMH